ncbi:MAG: YaaR family protein [Clostridiales bacterium]|jgi:uncharacterized protein YaaR (DUF327 family)|nr:YaaR family protein [Clostridiales bacterium]
MAMKISEISSPQAAEFKPRSERAESGDFKFTLNRVDDENLAERLNGLMGEITVHGKQLADHMDIKDMKKYRSLISDFINEVVTHSHKFSRENFLDRRGRHRVYGIVRLVDKELDSLAQELLSRENDHLAILEKVNEIQGLLLDIMA